jgi:hypothetical protein
MESFYATVTSFNFVLMGLWWSVVQSRKEWLENPEQRSLSRAVYLGFLVPGVMSLAAQLGQDTKILWQMAFFIAALSGGFTTMQFLQVVPASSEAGWFRRNQWVVIGVYALVAMFALRPDLAFIVGLQPLQVEGVLIAVLVFFGVSFAWELVTEPRASAVTQTPQA